MSPSSRQSRVLTVMVDGWLIEDGSVRPPTVGETLSVCLEFYSRTRDDARLMSIRAAAHPASDRVPIRSHDGRLHWETVLRGDGWSAAWSAERPAIGEIAESGMFYVDHSGRTDAVRGLVTRVQSAFGTMVFGSLGWEYDESAVLEVRDVQQAPRWFDEDFYNDTPDLGDRRRHHMGVVIDLDLDAAPPPPLRPRVVPSAVSAVGTTLWLLDQDLPVLVRVIDPAGAAIATEYVLPAGVVSSRRHPQPRRVFANETGCWVVGGSDVVRCSVESELDVRRYDLGTVRHAAVHHEKLMIVTEHAVVSIGEDDEARQVSMPEGATRRILDSAPTDDGFVLLGVGGSPRTGRTVEVDRSGHVSSSTDFTCGRALFIVNTNLGVRVFTYHGVVDAQSGRTLFARSFLDGGRVGDRVWVTMHRPDGSGRTGWWPVQGGAELPSPGRGRWLFVVLDPTTFEVERVEPIATTRPDVTEDAGGRIWIGGLGVRGFAPDGNTVDLDVSSLLP